MFLETKNARISFEVNGSGPPIVLSHGLFMDATMFDEQVATLEAEFTCITWDQRGHGQTEAEGSYTYWDSADDLLNLLDHLEIEAALLVGMSQGGFLSLRAALKAPDRLKGLFLLDTQAGSEPKDVLPFYEAMAEEWASRGPSMNIVETVAGVILGPAEPQPWVEDWMTKPRDYVTEPFRCLVGREDITDRLNEIEVPALVVHGEIDAAIPVESAKRLCEGLPKCEGFEVIPGAGHAANLSHPREVNELLIDFARRHATGP